MFRWILIAMAVITTTSRGEDVHTRWYSVELFGAKSGVMKSTEENKDGKVYSGTDVTFEIRRGETSIKISMNSEFVETADGKAISMKSVQNLGLKPITQEYTFRADGVELQSSQSGQKSASKLPIPEDEWLTPAAADRFMTQRFKSGAKEIVVRSIDPTSGIAPVTSTRKVGEKTKIKVMGREIEVTKCVMSVSTAPGIASTEYLDSEGVMVRTETQLGGIAMIMTMTTAEEAAAKPAEGATIPDAFTGTFIKPDKHVDHPRELGYGVYQISVEDGELDTLPDTGAQKFERTNAKSGKLTVDTKGHVAAPEKDASDPAFLASTSMCNIQDDRVLLLATKAIASLPNIGSATNAEKAEACRAYVYRFIKKKSLGVGFASATEVARSNEGDCTEHGVLLCALLRAHKIPARVASGLLYADSFAGAEHIFGYHMWAQALLTVDSKPCWVDLDGTLSSVAFDATHICLGTSDLADGDPTRAMTSLATSMGKLHISVLEQRSGKVPTP
jgi:hypothetical protein